MSISFLRKRYPIAVWMKDTKLETVTFGWDNFKKKFLSIAGDLSLLPKDWIERQESKEEVIHYLSTCRKEFKIGSYSIGDGIHGIYKYLADRVLFENLNLYGFNSDDFYALALIHKGTLPKLYFTAPEKYSSNISKGIQPIRWSSYYQREEASNLNKQNLTFDKTEGVEKNEEIDRVDIDTNVKKFVSRLTNQTKHFDGFIFSMHDENISENDRKHFGKTTYYISDIHRWSNSIINEVHKYLEKKAAMPNACDEIKNYIGIMPFIGQCAYTQSKTTKKAKGTMEDVNFPLFQRVSSGKMVGVKIQNLARVKNLLITLEKDFFEKPMKHAGQSEWRLIVIPIWANEKGAGYIYQHLFYEEEFYTKNLSAESLQKNN